MTMWSLLQRSRRSFLVRLSISTACTTLALTGIALPGPRPAPAIRGVVPLGEATAGSRRTVPFPIQATLVGFDWEGTTSAELEVRVRKADGWSSWVHIDGGDEGPDPGSPEHRGRTTTAPVWVGDGAEAVEFEVEDTSLTDFRLHLVRSVPADAGFSPSSAQAAPGIIPRSDWGADETWRTCGPSYARQLKFSVVHHTATANDYSPEEAAAIIRGIYAFHTQVNGWCDIGYNFLVDKYGRIYEGRFGGIDRTVIGAHAAGFNTGSTGVAFIGDYRFAALSPEARSALHTLLAWKLSLHEVDADSYVDVTSGGSSKYPPDTVVTLNTISGHRDVSLTACPGDVVYGALPGLRPEIQRDIESSSVFANSGWEALGGVLSSGPDAASWGLNRIDVFGRGTDNALWHKWWDGSSWSHWEPLGGVLSADPGVVSWGSGRLDVFVKGADEQLWHRWHEGGAWSDWEPLGGVLASGPDAASWGPGRIDVSVRGTDNALWHKWWDGRSWSDWEPLGGVLKSDPTAVSWGSGRIDVFARGEDDALYHKWFDRTSWADWERVGANLRSSPDVSSLGAGRLDVFAANRDLALRGKIFDQSWKAWDGLGGRVSSDPSAVSWGPLRIDVFVRGADMQLWHTWYDKPA
jgi:hypothetical protein